VLIASIALVGYLLDFGVKEYVLANYSQPVPILGGVVVFTLVRNPGAAFSMGEGFTVGFSVLALVALIFVTFWLAPRVRNLGWAAVTGLLWAGIAGNLTDRLFRSPGPFHGEVVDMIQVPYFAVFNVADMWITFAAIGLLYLSVVKGVGLKGENIKDEKHKDAK
jgi:signal peptidase II